MSQLPECILDTNNTISYSCSNPYPDCSNPFGFQFASLWLITQAIYNACPSDPRLFKQSPSLTQEGCSIFSGGDDWTRYPAADIWARLTTWKFPLFQLVAVFPKPPLGFLSGLFVLVHVLGDPVSTISNLLLKAASCQRRARFWKNQFSEGGALEHLLEAEGDDAREQEASRLWKGLAAIVDSYDEWGQEAGNKAEQFILNRLSAEDSSPEELERREKFLELCVVAASSLAADRATNFFPIIVAQCLFIGTVGIAVGRTKSSASGPDPTVFINVETYSIAFTAVYFYIIPAVILGFIIGVSQTEGSIPRILSSFSGNVQILFPPREDSPINSLLASNILLCERGGGLYSWQTHASRKEVQQNIKGKDAIITPSTSGGRLRSSWERDKLQPTTLFKLRPGSQTLPHFILFYSTFTGMLITYLVPPVGIECRHIGIFLIYIAWVGSSLLNYIPFSDRYSKFHFLFILTKDILAAGGTIGGIAATQVGVFNRCSCYTLWGKTGLALPQGTSEAATLMRGIQTVYPAIAFLCVGFQLIVVMGIVLWQYELAIRVFLQRDDGESNLNWLDWVKRAWRKVSSSWRWVVGRFEGLGQAVRNKSPRVWRRRIEPHWEMTEGVSRRSSESPLQNKYDYVLPRISVEDMEDPGGFERREIPG